CHSRGTPRNMGPSDFFHVTAAPRHYRNSTPYLGPHDECARPRRMNWPKSSSDAAIDPVNRTLMSFAAYNVGPRNLQKFRTVTQQAGLDPNIWFNNVELGAAKVVGLAPVQYVSNIYKYYISYQLSVERLEGQRKAHEDMRTQK